MILTVRFKGDFKMARVKKVTQRSFSCTDEQMDHLKTFASMYGLTVSQMIQKFAEYLWSGKNPSSHCNQIAKLFDLKEVSEEVANKVTRAQFNREKGALQTKKLRNEVPGQTDLFDDKEP